MTPEQQLAEDMRELSRHAPFQRLVLRVIQSAGIFSRTTDGSTDRHLAYDEGRRNLGLEFLSWVEAGQPATHPDGLPYLSVIQAFREEANKPQEKPNGRRSDRYSELSDDGTDGDD